MKKFLKLIIVLYCFHFNANAQQDFILKNPTMLPNPGSFPGGTETIGFDFYVTQTNFTFSSDPLSNDYAAITFSFTKLDPTGLPPTGDGAALFNWVLTSTGTGIGKVYTWTGTTKDIEMEKSVPEPGHSNYKIIFSNIPITFPATKAETDIRVAGGFTDPPSGNGGQPTEQINNFSVIATYTCPVPVVATTSVTHPTCVVLTGSITITAPTGIGYTYSKDGGTTYGPDATFSNLTSGLYNVAVKNADGCVEAAAGVTIQNIPTPPVASINKVNVSCFGNSTGSIDLSVSGGTPAFNYLWSPGGATTQDLSGLAAGIYTVTITDAKLCTTITSVTITQPAAALNATNTKVNVLCFGNATGSVDLTVSGGTPGYSYQWSNAAVTQDLTGLIAGTYTVTVTDANGCKTTSSATITQPAAALNATNTKVNVLCFGSATGSVDLTVSGGTPGYTYQWSNAAITQDISGLAAGTYTVTVTDANGCKTTSSATITQPATAVSASALASTATCGIANGSVNLTVSGGVPGYTFLWSNGAVTEDLTNVAAGTYNVTVTDVNGCKTTTGATVNNANGPTANNTKVNVLCFGNSTGSVDVTVTGGTPGYSYLWSNGATTQDLSSLSAGAYNVTVTDANGCIATSSAIITQPTAALNATNSKVNVLCFGNATGSVDLSVSGGTPGYTYQWSNAAITQDISGLVAGTYTVTVTDANGCKTTSSATITQPATALNATNTKVNVLCFGSATGSVDLTVTGGTPGYTYQWSNAAITQDLNGVVAGTYTVTVTDANGCKTTSTATITQPASGLNATNTKVNVLCFGNATGSVDLTITGGTTGYTYQWSNAAITQDITGLAAGTYTVTVTDASGCMTTSSATITQPAAALNATNTKVNVLCFGNATGSIDLTVSGGTTGYTYQWSNAAITQDITGLIAGTYTVTVTDANGCKVTSTATITQPAAALNATNTKVNVLCFGSATGSVDLTVSGGTPGYTYAWSNASITQDISGLVAGIYTVTVTDASGCKTTSSATITQPASALNANAIAGTSTCGSSNGSVNLNVSGGTPGYTYLWNNGALTEDINGVPAGIYTVTITDANNCKTTAGASVNNTNGPTLSNTHVNVLCFGNSTGSIDLSVSGGTAPYTYNWGGGITTQDRTGLGQGNYSVTVTDANLCTAFTSVLITQPAAALSPSTTKVNVLCFGNSTGSIDLSVSGGTALYTYNWGGGITTQDRTGLGQGTYTVTITDANLCTAVTSATITQPAAALNAATTKVNVLCFGNSTGSIDLSVSGGTAPYSYNWGGGITSQDRTGLGQGTYTVTVTDANGCATTTSSTITQPASAVNATALAISSTCGNANGSVNLTVSGGTPAYSYKWSNGATTEDISNVLAGLYVVTVTDANGCAKTTNATVANIENCTTELSIVKSGPGRMSPGELITYTITVSATVGDALNVIITDNVPAIIENIQYSLNGSTGWTNWTGSYNAGTILEGTSFSLYLRGTVGLLACDFISNTASVTTSTTELNTLNNTSNTVTSTVYQPGSNDLLANYSFDGADAYPFAANQTVSGLNSSVNSSELFALALGLAPGFLAFDFSANAGQALRMQPSTGNNTRYFQFTITGVNLLNYSKFKLYLQAKAFSQGAKLLTFAYSTDGINFINNGTLSLLPHSTWYETVIDWTGVHVLNSNTLQSLYIRIYPSGSNDPGTDASTALDIDNFQVLGLHTIIPIFCNPLPATGMELSANLQNDISYLKWYTLSEQNTSHFVVERSFDGRTFTSISSKINAAGSSFSRIDYAYNDNIKSLTSKKVIYYRVKLFDKDGSFKYTNVVVVRINAKEGISVLPNPFTSNISVNISTDVTSQYNLKLLTTSGQQVLSKKIKVQPGTTVVSLQNLGKYAKGTYVLYIENETTSSLHVEKVVKF